MKKLLLVAIILMSIVLILGISWGKLFKKGYTQDECGVELAKRDQKIECVMYQVPDITEPLHLGQRPAGIPSPTGCRPGLRLRRQVAVTHLFYIP